MHLDNGLAMHALSLCYVCVCLFRLMDVYYYYRARRSHMHNICKIYASNATVKF